tara:strand:+ start:219 stop:461 length:243 start_codon:yes stop_codon:yes gene_type:complete
MKIQVNKNQQAINLRTHIWTIITIAEQKAKAGIGHFKYPIPRDVDISTLELIDAVEEATEESVYGGTKCISDGRIRFSIR